MVSANDSRYLQLRAPLTPRLCASAIINQILGHGRTNDLPTGN